MFVQYPWCGRGEAVGTAVPPGSIHEWCGPCLNPRIIHCTSRASVSPQHRNHDACSSTSLHPLLQVVNVAQGMSIGPALYLWTHRLTNADVVSVVTTTRPFISTPKVTMTPTAAAADGGLPVASAIRGGGGGGSDGRSRRSPFDGSLGRLKGGDKMKVLSGV